MLGHPDCYFSLSFGYVVKQNLVITRLINRENMSNHEEQEELVKVPKGRKKVSKRTKKSWRKHTDVKDVEEHLEDLRQEERTGGIVSEKKDELLYFLDKDIRDDGKGAVHEQTKRSNEKQVDEVSSDEEPYMPRKAKLMKRMREEQKKEEEEMVATTFHPKEDVWGVKPKKEPLVLNDAFVDDTLPKKPKKPKTVGEKISHLPAVEVGDGGQSYNPEYDDHQALLLKAHNVESEKLAKKEKVERSIKYLTEQELASKPTWVEEMSEGLNNKKPAAEEATQAEGSGDVLDETSSIRTERKTQKRRRKELEEKEERRKRKQDKVDNVRQNEIFRLKTIHREIEEEEANKKERERKKRLKEQKEADNPKKLGKHKYEEPSVPLKLTDELVGTLRELKPEGSLMVDRFKSLQKRNIIEPRKAVVPHRKYKVKEYTKRSYNKPTIKDFGKT